MAYFYDQQIRRYLVQFMSVFEGLQVSFGANDYGSDTNLVNVPIQYGSADRVVAALKAGNNTNTPLRPPCMAATLIGLDPAPDRKSGSNTTIRRTRLPLGGSFPEDIETLEYIKPVPYTATLDLAILASNTDQHLQMLEQLLLLFGNDMQLQVSDNPHDINKLAMVTLTNVNFEERLPAGVDPRLIMSTLTFQSTFYLSPPVKVRNNAILAIRTRLAQIAASQTAEGALAEVVVPGLPYETLIDTRQMNLPER